MIFLKKWVLVVYLKIGKCQRTLKPSLSQFITAVIDLVEKYPINDTIAAGILIPITSKSSEVIQGSGDSSINYFLHRFTLYDLYVSKKRGELKIAKKNASLKALEEISCNSHTIIANHKKDKGRIEEVLDRLTSELYNQEHNVVDVLHQ